MIKRMGAFFLLLSLLLPCLTSCRTQREKIYYQYFDTVITLSADKEGFSEFEDLCTLAEEAISKYHRLLDVYHTYSGMQNLATVNRGAGNGEPVRIDRWLFDFLKDAKVLYEKTGGHMNIMMGAVTSLWNQARADASAGSAALPGEDALSAAMEHVSMDLLVLDEENSTAYISDPEALLDVGAYGKGYAAERVAELLLEKGVKNGFVLDFGGNLRVIGSRADGKPYVSGIHDPSTEQIGKHALRVTLSGESLVTSGSYFRYFEIDGKKYHHLIDPETARPADRFLSVSVLGADSGLCDALSTALFVMTLEEGRALMSTLPGYEAVWIDADGEVYTTAGIDARLSD